MSLGPAPDGGGIGCDLGRSGGSARAMIAFGTVARTAYHHRVQELVVIMLVALVGLGAVAGALAIMERRGRITRMQIVIGAVVGLIAAFAILVARVDLIEDGSDDLLQRLFAVALTAAAVIGSLYRIVRA